MKGRYNIDIFLFRLDNATIKDVVKPFDWTYTTDYKGTLSGSNLLQVQKSVWF